MRLCLLKKKKEGIKLTMFPLVRPQHSLNSVPSSTPSFIYFQAIAAVGSIFEYTNKNPIFGVLGPDSPFYTPILGLFAVTGLPTAGYLFFKAVTAANRQADEMDRIDKGL
jgi:hypothetical protein